MRIGEKIYVIGVKCLDDFALSTIRKQLELSHDVEIISVDSTHDLPEDYTLPPKRDFNLSELAMISFEKKSFLDDKDFYKSRRKSINGDWENRIKNLTRKAISNNHESYKA